MNFKVPIGEALNTKAIDRLVTFLANPSNIII